MSLSLSAVSLSAVVARLRAAGCVFAEDEAQLLVAQARTLAELDEMAGRRAAGLPLEQILGWAEFCGLRVTLEPGVFVPRRRTEFLVHEAVRCLRDTSSAAAGPKHPTSHETVPLVVVDLCCGSGAVGAALGVLLGQVELYAADIDPAAVRCARRNLASAGGHVYEGDLYEPLPTVLQGRVDVLVANAPYVPTEEVALLPAEARDHEPRVALDGGADGLHTLRRVAAGAPRWLAPGGQLLVETSERQAPPIAAVMTGSGLSARVAVSDELGTAVVIGTRPAAVAGNARSGPIQLGQLCINRKLFA
jgi:release factor glutamine methyltransferase